MKLERIIISGGGTGGHIFPAIAIADEIKLQNPSAEILFIGALGKMEMEKIPAAGYQIIGLDIRGFQRKLTLSNLVLPFKILKSLWKAHTIIKKFNPQVVIGVGGYASGPTLQMANMLRIPTVLQEQNSFPGKTNRILAKKASAICGAYDGLESVFQKEKLHITGNPVRLSAIPTNKKSEELKQKFGFDSTKKVVLVIGGSLGAKTLNDSIYQNIEEIEKSDIQLIWQVGSFYYENLHNLLKDKNLKNIQYSAFIQNMSECYQAADCIISRAGALSVSELCLVQKPVILVPSPNVAEDHQTKNAQALVSKNAAILVKDTEARENLVSTMFSLVSDISLCEELSRNITPLGKANATKDIVRIIETVARK